MPKHGIGHRLRNVHAADAVAELIGFRALQFDRAVAGDVAFVPAGTGGLQVAENLAEQFALERAHRLGCEAVSAVLAFFQSLSFSKIAEIVLDHLLQLPQLVHVARLGVLLKRFHIDVRQLCILHCILELLEQAVDFFEFFFDLKGLLDVHLFPAGEVVLERELVDLVLVAEPTDQAHELLGRFAGVISEAVEESLKIADLFFVIGFR